MKIVVDTHTHTIASGHAYSSVQEMIEGALRNGIEMIALTDHGPSMQGASDIIYFANLKEVPSEFLGVHVLRGVEANVIDFNGNLDVPDWALSRLDFCLAGFHDICIEPKDIETHTNAMIEVFKNPYIDAVSHPGNPVFQVDISTIVAAAKKYDKFIEINNHSFEARVGSENNCKEFAIKCKEMGVKVVCGSDAHFSTHVGRFDKVYRIFREIDFPESLVLNTSVQKVQQYLDLKRKKISKLTN